MPPRLSGLRRHWLVWVAQAFHPMLGAQVTDLTLRDIASRFLAANWPLVMCRQGIAAGELAGAHTPIALGMPLPPAQGKHRIAFAVPPATIARTAPPPVLADLIPRLPLVWRAPLRQLVRGSEAIGIELRVFGSAAWEGLAGSGYLTPASDIDLLWRPIDAAQVAAGIALLREWEANTGLVADGEILFGDDAAVAWREWPVDQPPQGGAHRVLVKTLRGPQLCAPGDLLGRLARRRATRAEVVPCA